MYSASLRRTWSDIPGAFKVCWTESLVSNHQLECLRLDHAFTYTTVLESLIRRKGSQWKCVAATCSTYTPILSRELCQLGSLSFRLRIRRDSDKDPRNVSAVQSHDKFHEVPDSEINILEAYVYSIAKDQTAHQGHATSTELNFPVRNGSTSKVSRILTTSSDIYHRKSTYCATAWWFPRSCDTGMRDRPLLLNALQGCQNKEVSKWAIHTAGF